jgi:hypothetical protein
MNSGATALDRIDFLGGSPSNDSPRIADDLRAHIEHFGSLMNAGRRDRFLDLAIISELFIAVYCPAETA